MASAFRESSRQPPNKECPEEGPEGFSRIRPVSPDHRISVLETACETQAPPRSVLALIGEELRTDHDEKTGAR